MAEKPQTAPVKDINQIVRYLTSTFNAVTSSLDKANRGKVGPNQLYKLQSEFAYRLNEVMQGSRSLLQRNITECNEYIDEVMQLLNKADIESGRVH
jgi:hypothetical protein